MRRLDDGTLETLAELICGDGPEAPVYRKGYELTSFFARAGLERYKHDGSTRKWWTLETLQSCWPDETEKVIIRLAHPKEYRGDPARVRKAVAALNRVLAIEGYQVELLGVEPRLVEVDAALANEVPAEDLKPLPPPDFHRLRLMPGLADILAHRWDESDRCVSADAHLAGVIVMGSLLEGLLLAVVSKRPEQSNRSGVAPKDRKTGKVKPFEDWTLSELINVAHAEKWVDLDVKRFSHALREFRNLVHPSEQLRLDVHPDKDTCSISWLVVQAAVNDLAAALAAAGP